MNANELRIGNLIFLLTKQEVFEVVSITKNTISSNSYCRKYSEFEGIPLTEEVLSRCEFNMIDDFTEHAHIDLDLQHYITFLEDENLIIIECDDCCYNIDLNQIKYLHQLQNLYFALIGEELQINL